MRCTNKLLRALSIVLLGTICVTGCSGLSYSSKYSVTSSQSDNRNTLYYPTFASELCVAEDNMNENDVEIAEVASAGLFDLNKKETLFAKNVNMQVQPASLTKVMTALVALKYGKLDQVLEAHSDVYVTESGAQKINLKEGDRMTLDQALRILLIYSANDVANLIASNFGSSIEDFVGLMNKEAQAIGATNSHFANPHGLTADEHYVTAYDMYLIFNAAMQYDTFSEIINTTEYSTTYLESSGTSKEITVSTTNGYLKGDKQQPSGVTVIGGKTGTTQAAGHCLILLARDTASNPYIAVIMRDTDSGQLYTDMTSLLNEIVN
ncbi:D-alanyl-D-alanine carboxypeptidase family protein [Butyrivibrio sp. XPD2006]|uniref:D-alanyl-D-alanine carboxypeptidase family protein n=1 Tax=Butyrivibrio sp. XPD2006 TaxID=1280668 RepID=UPI0003B391AD|nr:serine hydrolase [Butyrivibrio sp. XPD2006]